MEQAARWTSRMVASAVAWATLAAPLLAAPVEEPVQEKEYVSCYLIIFFAIGLGLIMICRAGKRTLEFRRPD